MGKAVVDVLSLHLTGPIHDYNAQPALTGANQLNLCNPETTLWMGDLKPEWEAEFIKEAFRHFSHEIRNVKMVTDRYGGKSSYCFVEFPDAESARNAMLSLCGRSIPNGIDRSKFNLSFANSPNQCPEYNLFVSNLSSSVDDVALFRVFGERYTSCRGAKVYRNPDGSSREFGFVRFTNETDQQQALVEMNKHRLKGKEMILKLAQPKERRNRNFAPRSSYNDWDRNNGGVRGGVRYNGNGNPTFTSVSGPTSVVPMAGIVGGCLPMGPVSSTDQQRTMQHHQISQPYFSTNQAVPNYGIVQGGMQPYGAQIVSQQQSNSQFIPIQYVAQNSNMQYQNGSSVYGMEDLRNSHHSNYVPIAPMAAAPIPVYLEGEEPMTADEHNNFVMGMSSDFMTTLESSRWNQVAVPMGVRPKELTTMLYNV